MSQPTNLDLKLKSLGLTQYEIKTFKTLIAFASLTAEEIHTHTDIPTPRIYDTIDSLQKKGLVQILSGRPKRFEAVEPNIGLDSFIRQKEREYQDELDKMRVISKELTDLLTDEEFQSRLKIKPDELLEAYTTLKDMENKTMEIIQNARKEICVFTNVFYWFDKAQETIERITDSDIVVRVLMNIEDTTSRNNAKKLVEMGAQVRINTESSTLARGTLIDQEQVIFVIWVSPIKGEKYIYRPHFSSNTGIVELFSNNFEYLWEKGKEFTG